MKKKIIIRGIITCLIIVSAIYIFIPVPILNKAERVSFRIEILNAEYKYDDITYKIDSDKLAEIISKYTRTKIPHLFAPYQLNVGEISISIIGGSGPCYITLGNSKVNVVYESADRGGYTIYNSKELFTEIKNLITD